MHYRLNYLDENLLVYRTEDIVAFKYQIELDLLYTDYQKVGGNLYRNNLTGRSVTIVKGIGGIENE